MKRQFACTPEDMSGFVHRVTHMYGVYKARRRNSSDTIELDGSIYNPVMTLSEWLVDQLNDAIEEFNKHGLIFDKWTSEYIALFHRHQTCENFHYVLHHLVFQQLLAHKRGEIHLSRTKYKIYEEATEDCITDVLDPILSKENKGKFTDFIIYVKDERMNSKWKVFKDKINYESIYDAKSTAFDYKYKYSSKGYHFDFKVEVVIRN